MTQALERDGQQLEDALSHDGDALHVELSRETLELALQFVHARSQGKRVLFVDDDDELSPTEAAPLLGMSRPQVRKLIDQGLLETRKVGTHHRIKLDSIHRFKEAEKKRSQAAMEELSALQNELGLTE